MAVIIDISSAVPEFSISKEDFSKFYSRALDSSGLPAITKKLGFLIEKTKIINRFSCIPDFLGNEQELFTESNYRQPVERRMEIYKKNILPLATKAIDSLLQKNNIKPTEVTHFITVSCTGLFAPGLEYMLADRFNLQHTEKIALNFLGCYAALKALKHAHYIAQADPNACVLIVSAELCSLHFFPSIADEDIVANLLFSDGASAVLVCGNNSSHIKHIPVLNIDSIGSACIPESADLMTWDISSHAFRMYLSKFLVKAIKENIEQVVNDFLTDRKTETDYWAIHPGGIRIVEAVKESLQLTDKNIEDSMHILKNFGNMSSPTILFILKQILNNIRREEQPIGKSIFACAFGPGITVEMIKFSSTNASYLSSPKQRVTNYAVQV